MKKVQYVFSVVAFVFAVSLAFAFKPFDGTRPAYRVNNTCQDVPPGTTCNGDQNACLIDIPGDGVTGAVQIYEYSTSANCGVALKMGFSK